MDSLLELYIEQIHEEEEAFYDYIKIAHYETSKEKKGLILAIAEDELQHFTKLKEVLKGWQTTNTIMENAFLERLCNTHKDMKLCLEKAKGQ